MGIPGGCQCKSRGARGEAGADPLGAARPGAKGLAGPGAAGPGGGGGTGGLAGPGGGGESGRQRDGRPRRRARPPRARPARLRGAGSGAAPSALLQLHAFLYKHVKYSCWVGVYFSACASFSSECWAAGPGITVGGPPPVRQPGCTAAGQPAGFVFNAQAGWVL